MHKLKRKKIGVRKTIKYDVLSVIHNNKFNLPNFRNFRKILHSRRQKKNNFNNQLISGRRLHFPIDGLLFGKRHVPAMGLLLPDHSNILDFRHRQALRLHRTDDRNDPE